MLIIIPAPEFHYQSQMYSKLIFPLFFFVFFFKGAALIKCLQAKKKTNSDIHKLLNVPIKPGGKKKSYLSGTVI